MVDLKISQLTDGGDVQVTDEIPVNRGGTNFRVSIPSATSPYDTTVVPLGDFTTLGAAVTAGVEIAVVPGSDSGVVVPGVVPSGRSGPTVGWT